MIIDQYGRGCTSDTQDPWRRQQAEILLDNILQHEALWTLLNIIYIFYINQFWNFFHESYFLVIFKFDSIRPSSNAGALSLARVAQFPLYPNKNWGTSTYTTRKMWVELLRMSFSHKTELKILNHVELPTVQDIQGTLRSNTSSCAWCIRPAEIIFPKIVKSKTHLEINMFPCAPERWVWGIVEKLAIYKYILIILHQLALLDFQTRNTIPKA